jgi:hypothetical protein
VVLLLVVVLLVLLLLLLLLVVMLVPGGILADIVISLTIVPLIVRKDREGWATRTPVVGLTMRSGRRDHFLASVVESPEATALLLRRREATRVGVRGCCDRTARRSGAAVIAVAIVVVTASTGFLVTTSFFITRKGCYVAEITRPTTRAKKVFAARATGGPRLVSLIHLNMRMVRLVTRVERNVRMVRQASAQGFRGQNRCSMRLLRRRVRGKLFVDIALHFRSRNNHVLWIG